MKPVPFLSSSVPTPPQGHLDQAIAEDVESKESWTALLQELFEAICVQSRGEFWDKHVKRDGAHANHVD